MKKLFLLFLICKVIILNGQITISERLVDSWHLMGYLDSIEINKEVYKNSVGNLSPAFAQIIIKESMNSADFNGYHEMIEFELVDRNDKKLFYGYNGKKQIELSFQIENNDTILRMTTLRDGKYGLYQRLESDFKLTPESIKEYIIGILFVGKFQNENTTILFEKHGLIKGFDNYVKYDIVVNPYENGMGKFDQITFWDNANNYERFGWKFENNQLVLYKLIRKVDELSGFYFYEMEDEFVRLNKE